jgi:TatA/E family protein of Tat protein translocase
MVALRTPLAFLDILGGQEIALILVVVLIFFGGDKMPGFSRGLGKVMRELKKAASDVEAEFKKAMDESERPKPTTPPPVVARPAAFQEARPITLPPAEPPPESRPPSPPPGDRMAG